MTIPMISPNEWTRLMQESASRGEELRLSLDRVIQQWQTYLGTRSIRLVDRYDVPLTDSPAIGGLLFRNPLIYEKETQATLLSPFALDARRNDREYQNLLLETVLNLMAFMEWAETEAERRGEKIRLVLERGLTPDVRTLLALCGLIDDAPRSLILCATCTPIPFQRMEVLRRFVLARIWRYRQTFPWLAYSPDGMLFLDPMPHEKALALAHSLAQHWEASPRDFSIRLYVHPVDQLNHLPEALREAEALLQFASRFDITGVVNQHVDHHLAKVLANMSPDVLRNFVSSALQPLLVPENEQILLTLKEYLAHGQSLGQTARLLYVHPNTVLYRVHQAEKLLGIRLKNTEQLTNLWMALQAHTLLEALTR